MDESECLLKKRKHADLEDSSSRLSNTSTPLPFKNILDHSFQTSETNYYDMNQLIFDQELNKGKKVMTDKEQQTSNASSTIENVCWFVASLLAIYLSDIFNVLLYDQRIYRLLMMVSFALIGINISIAIYMIFWLTHVKKISSSQWNEKNPTLIPIATACFISGSLLLVISIWPVYSWLTAPLLFTIFMGFVVILINLSNWI